VESGVIDRVMKWATAALAVALFLAGCSQDGPHLQVVGDQSVALNLAVSDVGANQPYAFGSIMLCVSSPATARITNVAVDQAQGGIRVDAFAVRPNPLTRQQEGLGGQREALIDYSSTFAPNSAQFISGVCQSSSSAIASGDTADISELGVQVSWDGFGRYAGGHALDITYEIAGTEQTLRLNYGIWLCAVTCPPDLNHTKSLASQ
jgi:hypothetical protein